MAKTVGLPVGIATKLILNGEIKSTGVKGSRIKRDLQASVRRVRTVWY